MINDVVFRPATASDALAFYGKLPPARFRGFSAVQGDTVIAIGGVYFHDGHPVAFSDISDDYRKSRKNIAKGIKMLMNFIKELNVPVFALASPDEPTAPYLLAKLGFKPTGCVSTAGEYLMRSPD